MKQRFETLAKATPSMLPQTALFLALALGPAASADGPALSSALRDRLDQSALHLPGDTLDGQLGRSVASLASALLAPDDLTPADEAGRAAAAQERLLDGRPAVPTPAAAQRVFDRLVAELPPHLKPEAFRYRLTVLDRPNRDAFTTGGGLVCISRAWIDELLADSERGEAALAFVLADQMAHVTLGHARRAWERQDAFMGVVEDLPLPLPAAFLGVASGRFTWTAAECEEADRFALHLCRNAGFDTDAALDAVRVEAAGALSKDENDRQTANRGGLTRLKRLLMERDGHFDDETTHGLFLYDRASGKLERCGPRQVGPGERPVVFVHGLRGTEWAFIAYLEFFAKQPEMAGRPLLVFRYPNNESLSRCGRFLAREARRIIADPQKADFVCHSAGGLVFRWYAEVDGGRFDRAVFLATPHAGTRMAELKAFMDVGRFCLDLPYGLDYAAADAFAEGDGQARYDLHPDSLFLRRLDREKPPAEKYQILYGQMFSFIQSLELQYAFAVGKQYAVEAVADLVPFPQWQARLMRSVETAPLPEEIARGDLAVSARSASSIAASKATGLPLMHEAFRFSPDVIGRVLDALQEH